MKIENRTKTYIDEAGQKHEYTETVQINDDGTEVIRATVDIIINTDPKPEPKATQLDIIEANTTYLVMMSK